MVIGFVAVKNKKIIIFKKGVKLKVKDIAKKLINTDYDWAIFHTRLASVGNVSNENCHPFVAGNSAMAMNGTEHSVAFLNISKKITDTEAVFRILNDYQLSITTLKNLRSIFVGFEDGIPYMVANNITNIKLFHNKNSNAIAFASEFPYCFKKNIYELKKEYMWINEGIDHKMFRLYKPHKIYYPYYSSLWDYYLDKTEAI